MIRTYIVSFSALVFGASLAFTANADDKFSDDTYRQLELFGNVFERVRKGYVEDVSDQDLIEAAINGMLTSLDPHSSFMTAKSFGDMQEQTKGEFGGLGIEVTMENGFVKVVTPIDDTPAYEAGMQPNDYITTIDGESVLGLTLNDAVEMMRGLVDTDITIGVRREGVEPFDVTLTRAVIKIRSVRYRTEGDVGYIRITSFNEQTQRGLEEGIASIKDELGGTLKGYVLDLRNNPGGLLDQAESVSDTFLDRGEIVSTRTRYSEETKRTTAKKGDLTDGMPVVVLINDGSASASEIVAGALQDHGRAIILGTKSFGKGSVQTIIPMQDNSAMRLTTARYYTPSGRSIQGTGIEPDILVRPATVERLAQRSSRSEASLRGSLENDTLDDGIEEDEAASERTTQDVDDYQLARALDLIQGLALYRQTLTN
ncbi:MAG: S41 family peptidase [Rhodospirillaceae bacterium]|nr:S41 family peptidase [Rhodospirillaceae bacterium]MBT5242321.1 S41 family peptidase [Rhodospirillaceae bacterium]MBT5566049.1 S41 family peptidase [Rhodospirillaceae bacterium]MBT6088997.1 S41 family peptidase [Rhodospirillaceae bacterium]MBT7450372.1 S41 family peptidase [Rhodospirillaceae bacterium]